MRDLILTTRHNLANWTGEAGERAEARRLFAELLPMRVRVVGPDHPDTLTTRSNLAVLDGLAEDQREDPHSGPADG